MWGRRSIPESASVENKWLETEPTAQQKNRRKLLAKAKHNIQTGGQIAYLTVALALSSFHADTAYANDTANPTNTEQADQQPNPDQQLEDYLYHDQSAWPVPNAESAVRRDDILTITDTEVTINTAGIIPQSQTAQKADVYLYLTADDHTTTGMAIYVEVGSDGKAIITKSNHAELYRLFANGQQNFARISIAETITNDQNMPTELVEYGYKDGLADYQRLYPAQDHATSGEGNEPTPTSISPSPPTATQTPDSIEPIPTPQPKFDQISVSAPDHQDNNSRLTISDIADIADYLPSRSETQSAVELAAVTAAAYAIYKLTSHRLSGAKQTYSVHTDNRSSAPPPSAFNRSSLIDPETIPTPESPQKKSFQSLPAKGVNPDFDGYFRDHENAYGALSRGESRRIAWVLYQVDQSLKSNLPPTEHQPASPSPLLSRLSRPARPDPANQWWHPNPLPPIEDIGPANDKFDKAKDSQGNQSNQDRLAQDEAKVTPTVTDRTVTVEDSINQDIAPVEHTSPAEPEIERPSISPAETESIEAQIANLANLDTFPRQPITELLSQRGYHTPPYLLEISWANRTPQQRRDILFNYYNDAYDYSRTNQAKPEPITEQPATPAIPTPDAHRPAAEPVQFFAPKELKDEVTRIFKPGMSYAEAKKFIDRVKVKYVRSLFEDKSHPDYSLIKTIVNHDLLDLQKHWPNLSDIDKRNSLNSIASGQFAHDSYAKHEALIAAQYQNLAEHPPLTIDLRKLTKAQETVIEKIDDQTSFNQIKRVIDSNKMRQIQAIMTKDHISYKLALDFVNADIQAMHQAWDAEDVPDDDGPKRRLSVQARQQIVRDILTGQFVQDSIRDHQKRLGQRFISRQTTQATPTLLPAADTQKAASLNSPDAKSQTKTI